MYNFGSRIRLKIHPLHHYCRLDLLFSFLWKHGIVIVALSLYFKVSYKYQYTRTNGNNYVYVPDDQIHQTLAFGTTLNATQFGDKPACDYKPIISQNRYMFRSFYLDKLIDPSDIRPGGEFIPPVCRPRFSTAILIPYRKREEQLNAFIKYIHNFLRQQHIHYRIFVIEQNDTKKFNRGKLLNVGAIHAMKEHFPCLILHDVDLFPMRLGNLYACTKTPRQIAVNVDKYRFNLIFHWYFGGVTSMLTDTFKDINGMSNSFCGWGNEDLFSRVGHKEIPPIRFGPHLSQYSTMKHSQEMNNDEHYGLMANITQRYDTDGLNSLNYTLKGVNLLPLFTQILAEL